MDFMKMMKQASGLQEKMQNLQAEIADMEAEGSAGGGMVRLTLNGKGLITAMTLDDALLKQEEKEVLEDLIMAAHNDAKSNIETQTQEKMKEITGGLGLPGGMKLPF